MRGFVGGDAGYEDPVTGSLNAGLAEWLIGAGQAPPRYVAAQGAALGRDGRVHVERAGEDIWIGGDVVAEYWQVSYGESGSNLVALSLRDR